MKMWSALKKKKVDSKEDSDVRIGSSFQRIYYIQEQKVKIIHNKRNDRKC